MSKVLFDVEAIDVSSNEFDELVELLGECPDEYAQGLLRGMTSGEEVTTLFGETVNVPAVMKTTVAKKKLVPIYLILNGGDALLSKAIKLFTKGDYSHSSLSLTGFNEVVSFGTTKRNFGIVFENIFELMNYRKPKRLKVVAVMVEEEAFEKMAEFIEVLRRTEKKFSYSFKKLLLFPVYKSMKWKKGKVPEAMICSEFCNWLMQSTIKSVERSKLSDVIATKLPSPRDLEVGFTDEGMIVFEGLIKDLDMGVIKTFEEQLGVAVRKNKIIDKVDKSLDNKKLFKDLEKELFGESINGEFSVNNLVSEFDTEDVTLDRLLEIKSLMLYTTMNISEEEYYRTMSLLEARIVDKL